MGPTAIRRGVHRLRRRTAGMLALLALVGAVSLHHNLGLEDDHHGDGSAKHELITAGAELCMAAFVAVGAGAVCLTLGAVGLGRWPLVRSRLPRRIDRPAPTARARAGPPLLRVLSVWRI